MGRVPNNEYYSNDWEDEPLIIDDSHIALNVERIGKATPYSISPQIAMFTKKYSEKAQSDKKYDASDYLKYQEDWQKDYRDGKSFFVPENRWTHEVVQPPQLIKDNLYVINTSADIYPIVKDFEYSYDSGLTIRSSEYNFITRTLYKYVEKTDLLVDESELSDEWCPRVYVWKIRWLPKNNAKLTFFTNEDMVYWKTQEVIIDTGLISDTDKGVVEVPVIFKRGIKKALHYIKHDTPILYMKVDLYEN